VASVAHLAATLRQLDAPVLRRAVGLDQANVKIERAFRDRCAEIDGQRQRIAGTLRMVDQRPQDGRSRRTTERTDKGPVVLAGLALPAAVAGGDLGGVVEQVRCFCEHEIPWILPCSITAIPLNSMTCEVVARKLSVMAGHSRLKDGVASARL